MFLLFFALGHFKNFSIRQLKLGFRRPYKRKDETLATQLRYWIYRFQKDESYIIQTKILKKRKTTTQTNFSRIIPEMFSDLINSD